jgi:hypothetical protein
LGKIVPRRIISRKKPDNLPFSAVFQEDSTEIFADFENYERRFFGECPGLGQKLLKAGVTGG